MNRLSVRDLRADGSAVSDVVGSLLMVSVTVLLMAGLAFVILNIEGPADETNTDLVLTASAGSGGWGSGDETFTVQHQGGEPLPKHLLQVVARLNGAATVYENEDLDGGWSDGELTIGESWSKTLTLSQDDELEILVISNDAQNRVLASATVLAGQGGLDCSLDVLAPTVSSWVQVPSDITETTVGSVTITARLTDDCSGVDNTIDPSLEYRLESDPWTSTGTMTRIATDRWSGGIPDLTWVLQTGKTLHYRIVNMTDLQANSGTSVERSDAIELLSEFDYVESSTVVGGSQSGFANAQSAADAGAAATLTESMGTTTFYASTGVGSGGAQNPSNAAGAPNGNHATLDDGNERVTVSGFDTSGRTEAITMVEVAIESHYTGVPVNDDLNVQFNTGSWTTVLSDYVPPLLFDETVYIDITSNQVSWTWSDITNMQIRANYEKSQSTDAVDYNIDALFVRVTVAGGTNALEVRYQFPDLPVTTSGDLQLRYATTGDTFHVEVWDGATWTQRGATLDSASLTTWAYTLTGAEQEPAVGEGPRIRFIDDTPGGGSNGVLSIDYARVSNA